MEAIEREVSVQGLTFSQFTLFQSIERASRRMLPYRSALIDAAHIDQCITIEHSTSSSAHEAEHLQAMLVEKVERLHAKLTGSDRETAREMQQKNAQFQAMTQAEQTRDKQAKMKRQDQLEMA